MHPDGALDDLSLVEVVVCGLALAALGALSILVLRAIGCPDGLTVLLAIAAILVAVPGVARLLQARPGRARRRPVPVAADRRRGSAPDATSRHRR